VEALDIVNTGETTDVHLSLEDIVSMTDDGNELKILKGQDDTVTIDGQEYGADTHEFTIDGTMVKVTIEDQQNTPDIS
jgi:hypothetical protein